jgi:antitoxin FitA
MSAVTIRGLSEETHRALKVRAASAGRSTEAEIRLILENTVRPKERIRVGDALAAIGRSIGLRDQDQLFERDKKPAKPMKL